MFVCWFTWYRPSSVEGEPKYLSENAEAGTRKERNVSLKPSNERNSLCIGNIEPLLVCTVTSASPSGGAAVQEAFFF